MINSLIYILDAFHVTILDIYYSSPRKEMLRKLSYLIYYSKQNNDNEKRGEDKTGR
jgi:hypothetical protein